MVRIGVARVEITPDWPVSMSGFASRTHRSDGVAHPLHVRAMLMDDGASQALLLCADLLNWGPEQLPGLRRALSERLGIARDAILFSASHSHSGPQVTLWQAPSVGVADPRMLDLLEQRVLEVAAAATKDVEEVSISRGTGRHDLAMNRRRIVDGKYAGGPNPDGPVDREVTVLAYHRSDGSLKAVLNHYTCHPVISSEHLLSGEFTGFAMDRIEAETGAVSLYLQGCCGDINPSGLSHSTIADVEREGEAFAGVLNGIRSDLEELPPAPLGVRWTTTELPFEHVPTQQELRASVDADGVDGEWARALLTDQTRLRPSATFVAQRLDLGAEQSLLAMNGEVTVEYGLDIKAASGGRILPVGYSNGMIGYLPRAYQLPQGGYEVDSSTRYYLLPSRFAPGIEDGITTCTRRLIDLPFLSR
ncbi:MAG TPA: neutral/alkaline non-lysosomal ceramidase N-terminal domain-containing protein [Mycobacteriales bacterium]|nr:neutral/alkaline non-lysosomal ceramidase N-terminal domain-containing protein [Mycobacteriales bacterium]